MATLPGPCTGISAPAASTTLGLATRGRAAAIPEILRKSRLETPGSSGFSVAFPTFESFAGFEVPLAHSAKIPCGESGSFGKVGAGSRPSAQAQLIAPSALRCMLN